LAPSLRYSRESQPLFCLTTKKAQHIVRYLHFQKRFFREKTDDNILVVGEENIECMVSQGIHEKNFFNDSTEEDDYQIYQQRQSIITTKMDSFYKNN